MGTSGRALLRCKHKRVKIVSKKEKLPHSEEAVI